MILLHEIVDCDIEMLENKAVCILHTMNAMRTPQRLQLSVSNLTKFLKCLGCERLKQVIGQTVRCKVKENFKVTHVSRMHLDVEEWIAVKEVTNEV